MISVSDLELLRESVDLEPSSPHLKPSSPCLEPSSPHLAEERDTEGRLLSEHLSLSVVDDLSMLSDAFRVSLEAMAFEPRIPIWISSQPRVVVGVSDNPNARETSLLCCMLTDGTNHVIKIGTD